MKITFAPLSSGYSYTYDSRTTSAAVDASGSTKSIVAISNPPSGIGANSWAGKEAVIIGGNADGFGEVISSTYYQYMYIDIDPLYPFSAIPDDGSDFQVLDLSINPATVIYDSETNDTPAVNSLSTTIRIYMSNPPNGLTSSWNSYAITFTSGNLLGETKNITGKSYYGYLYIDLASPLPVSPSAAEVVIIGATGATFGERITWLPDPEERLVFSTSIEAGFDSCEADISHMSEYSWGDISIIDGSRAEVWDDYGDKAWGGKVIDVVVKEDTLSVRCVGWADTFSDYTYSTSWPSSGNPTPIQVIKDIVPGNKQIRNTLHDIDASGALESNHSALGGYGWDFSDVPVLARDALDEMLRFGDGTSSFNPIFLQIWEDRTPHLFVGKSPDSLRSANADWMVDSFSLLLDSSGVVYEISSSDMKNKISVVYSDLETGNQETTAFYYDLESLFRYGAKEVVRSEGNMDSANAVGAAGIVSSVVSEVVSYSPIKVNGYIREAESGALKPVYKVRSGDVVSVPVVMQLLGGMGGIAFGYSKFMVGNTSYNHGTGEMSIEPFVNSQKIDVFMAGVT